MNLSGRKHLAGLFDKGRQIAATGAKSDKSATGANCGTGSGGFKPGNACGRGGSGASRLGGSPGGKDSYKDRIEGTQKEADLEVKKCNQAVKTLEAKLKAAEARATSPMTAIKSLVQAHDAVKAKKEVLTEALKESQARIAALKAQLKKKAPSQTSLVKAIDGELARMVIGIGGLKRVTALTEKLIKKADTL